MPQLFGTKLRHLRKQRGVTQAELAACLSLTTHTHISHLEAGRNTPSLELVVKIAEYLQVPTDYLLRDEIAVDSEPPVRTTDTAKQSQLPRMFGTKLRHLRVHRNLTQLDVASQLGLAAQAHISFLEADRKVPSIDLVLRLVDFFGVTTDYLLRDDIPVSTGDAPAK
jgi:transcriptional regulator with XRE-family HTH domain